MAQNYKSVYSAEFQQQIVKLVALGKNPKLLFLLALFTTF